MNQIILAGRLTKDLELKKTQSNIAYAHITIAVPREYKDDQGERQSDFFDVTLWREQAEYMTSYANKGDVVGLSGKLQKRKVEQDGNTQYITEIIANKIEILAKHNPTPKQEVKEVKEVKPSKPLAEAEDLPF